MIFGKEQFLLLLMLTFIRMEITPPSGDKTVHYLTVPIIVFLIFFSGDLSLNTL